MFKIEDLDKLPEEFMRASRTINAGDRYLYQFSLSSNVLNHYVEYMEYRHTQLGVSRDSELRIWGHGISEDKSLPDNHYELVKSNE